MPIPAPRDSYNDNPKAGWFAIGSGLVGILSFAALITAVITRETTAIPHSIWLLFRAHDAGAILQYLLFLPVIFVLWGKLKRKRPETTTFLRNAGVFAIGLTILFLLLIFPNLMADVVYMFPQGLFGLWLLTMNWKLKGQLPLWIRISGMVIGAGLILVGTFPPGYVFFVDPILAKIPAAPPEVIEHRPVDTPVNVFLHQILSLGSFTGVLPLPPWSILLGTVLVRKRVLE